MGLNVTYNQNLGNGIDNTAVAEVTREIFQRAAAKSTSTRTQTTAFDFSKFKKPEMGLDLYNADGITSIS